MVESELSENQTICRHVTDLREGRVAIKVLNPTNDVLKITTGESVFTMSVLRATTWEADDLQSSLEDPDPNEPCELNYLGEEDEDVVGSSRLGMLKSTLSEEDSYEARINPRSFRPIICSFPETRSRNHCRIFLIILKPTEWHAKFTALFQKNCDVWMKHNMDYGRLQGVEFATGTGDARPLYQPQRHIAYEMQEGTTPYVQRLVDSGLCQPGKGPWASPVILVMTPDKPARFCVNYRRLNAVTTNDVYPFNRIDNPLYSLKESRYYTTVDSGKAYWMAPIKPENREKAAFITPWGLYEFNVLPFGVVNGPSFFQRVMSTFQRDGDNQYADVTLVYISDILVACATLGQSYSRLKRTLDKCRAMGMKLNPLKCDILCKTIKYLGHEISGEC